MKIDIKKLIDDEKYCETAFCLAKIKIITKNQKVFKHHTTQPVYIYNS